MYVSTMDNKGSVFYVNGWSRIEFMMSRIGFLIFEIDFLLSRNQFLISEIQFVMCECDISRNKCVNSRMHLLQKSRLNSKTAFPTLGHYPVYWVDLGEKAKARARARTRLGEREILEARAFPVLISMSSNGRPKNTVV